MNTCRPKPPLPDRPLIGCQEAEHLGVLFKNLSHPTRLRIIHALIRCGGDLSVNYLAAEVGMAVQALSKDWPMLGWWIVAARVFRPFIVLSIPAYRS